MDLRFRQIVILTLTFVLAQFQPAWADDWAYEPGQEAKKIYITKQSKSCDTLSALTRKNETALAYEVIRDAGLFKDESCRQQIRSNIGYINKYAELKGVVSFYEYMLGDKNQLNVLASIFDREAKKIGDHWIIELFGYLGDWDISGKRLVRHARYSDGAGSELLCSALMWRRFLYGEKDFEMRWDRIGKEENVDAGRLQRFREKCF